ncbi:MAG: hypothetical protein IPJ88_17970 [Myxococcales bacterium]|nr:MAG: hypothetical protein IPJ88_17970 [Myxococcales bacterium]
MSTCFASCTSTEEVHIPVSLFPEGRYPISYELVIIEAELCPTAEAYFANDPFEGELYRQNFFIDESYEIGELPDESLIAVGIGRGPDCTPEHFGCVPVNARASGAIEITLQEVDFSRFVLLDSDVCPQGLLCQGQDGCI